MAPSLHGNEKNKAEKQTKLGKKKKEGAYSTTENTSRAKQVQTSELCEPPEELLEFSRAVYCETAGAGLTVDKPWDAVDEPPYQLVLMGIACFINKLALCANNMT